MPQRNLAAARFQVPEVEAGKRADFPALWYLGKLIHRCEGVVFDSK
jgi:hypothetical protein